MFRSTPPEDPHGYKALFQGAVLVVCIMLIAVLVAIVVVGSAVSAR